MRTTRDMHKAITTATRALEAGQLDTARRSVVYALSVTGLREQLGFAPSADATVLALCLRALRAEVARRDLEAQRVRSAYAPVRA